MANVNVDLKQTVKRIYTKIMQKNVKKVVKRDPKIRQVYNPIRETRVSIWTYQRRQ